MQTNALRGLLYELCIVLPKGHRVLLKHTQDELAKAQERVRRPEVVVASAQDQLRRIAILQDDIDQLDRRLANKLARTAWAALVKCKVFDQVRCHPVDLVTA